MLVTSIKTTRITAGKIELLALLDQALKEVKNGSVIAITSKIVSLCENSVIPIDDIDKEKLITQEANFYVPATISRYGIHFTNTNNVLIPNAGIDESNGDGNYILWPKDSQTTANKVRVYLKEKFNLQEVGVIITDSTCHPLRRGTAGIVLAHSGFLALNSYIGKPDLFGKPFDMSQADVAGGLSAAAVLQMGEGTEQTPLAIISDIPFVTFQDRNPNIEELKEINITLEEDLFAPFLTSVDWQKGERKQKQ